MGVPGERFSLLGERFALLGELAFFPIRRIQEGDPGGGGSRKRGSGGPKRDDAVCVYGP